MAQTDCWESPLVYRVRVAMLTVLRKGQGPHVLQESPSLCQRLLTEAASYK